MNLELVISGGFAPTPTMSSPYSVDTTAVDHDRAKEIESIVQEANFFNLPRRMDGTNPGAADYFTYTLTIKDGDRVHTVTLTDQLSDGLLMRLIDILQASAHPK